MRQFFDWLADRCRSWTASCIPKHLALPEIELPGLHAGSMRRSARLSDSQNMTFGIFELLGQDEACRASRAWRPSVLLAMEEVSLTFHLVEQQRQIAEIVSRQNIDRLTAALHCYFRRAGRLRSEPQIRAEIETWLQHGSAPHATTVSPVRRQIGIKLPLLQELHLIDGEISQRIVGMHGRPATLECVGLILDKELDDSRYPHCTPLNCRTFANTGGDGAHFSLLVEDDMITETSPVVVTAPDSFSRSTVLASSLRDFLRLGTRNGYFRLGQVPHAPEKILREQLTQCDLLSEPYQHQTIHHLCQRLNLVPWDGPEAYRSLQERYAGQLRYPPEMQSLLDGTSS